MFRIVCMVEDKNLPKVLHAMAGLVLSMEPPQPVLNAVVKGGVVQQDQPGTTVRARLLASINSLAKGTEFTSQDFKKWITNLGGSDSSYSHYMNEIKETKLVKMKRRGHYVKL